MVDYPSKKHLGDLFNHGTFSFMKEAVAVIWTAIK